MENSSTTIVLGSSFSKKFIFDDIWDFYNYNKIPHVYLNVKINQKGKKDMYPPVGWREWNYEKCNEFNKTIDTNTMNATMANLANTDYMVIDNDESANTDALFAKYGRTHFTLSFRNKLHHFYRERNEFDMDKTQNKNCGKYDLLYGQVLEPLRGENMFDWNEPIPFAPVEETKPKAKKQEKPKSDYVFESGLTDFDRDILDLIDQKYWDDYDSWLRLINIIMKIKNDAVAADRYSQKSSKYVSFTDTMKHAFNKELTFTWGTVMEYAKQSNPEEYEIIKIKHKPHKLDFTDMGIAELLVKIKGDDFVFQDNTLYYCDSNDPFWKYDDEDRGAKYKIYTDLFDYYRRRKVLAFNEIKSTEEKLAQLSHKHKEKASEQPEWPKLKANLKAAEELIEIIDDGIKHCKTSARLTKYVDSLKMMLSSKCKKIHFDTLRPYVICFENGNIDVRTREHVEIKKEDYITKKLGYEWREPTEEEQTTIKQIIERILPNDEIRKCYMSALWCGMVGKQTEKFIVATGGGRNGKGVVNELVESALTDIYFYTGNVTAITENIKGGANQELANMNKKRAILFSEPNDSLKLKLGNIKSMTGNTKMNARALYSKNTDVIMQNMTFLECNSIPGIEGRIDASAAERFMIIDFNSHFTNDEFKLKIMKNCFPLDPTYKTDEFKQQHKFALLDYIFNYNFTDIYLPKIVKKRTKDYLLGCDDFYTWFSDNYERTDTETDVVKIIDLYEVFRKSAMWENMPKADRRTKWTKSKVIDNIKNNISLGCWYKERYKKNGLDVRNCIMFHRKRENPIE